MDRRTAIKALGAAALLPLVPGPRSEFEYDLRPGHQNCKPGDVGLKFYSQSGEELDLAAVACDPKSGTALVPTFAKSAGRQQNIAFVVDRNDPQTEKDPYLRVYLQQRYKYELGNGRFIPMIRHNNLRIVRAV